MAKFDYKSHREAIEAAVDTLIDQAYDIVDLEESRRLKVEDELDDVMEEMDALKKELAGALSRCGYLERRLAEAQKCGFSEN